MCGEFPFREATLNCPIFADMIENAQWPDMETTEWFTAELRELFRGAANLQIETSGVYILRRITLGT